MLIKQTSPFRNQIFLIHKKLQILKLREYIYNYLNKMESVSKEEACAIANLDGVNRLTQTHPFSLNDLRYINGRLEEIEKLNSEILVL